MEGYEKYQKVLTWMRQYSRGPCSPWAFESILSDLRKEPEEEIEYDVFRIKKIKADLIQISCEVDGILKHYNYGIDQNS